MPYRWSAACAARSCLRTAFADLLGRLTIAETGLAISRTTEATLDAALHVARRSVARDLDVNELPIDFAVIAMGRLGGYEIGYGSDADVMFVYESRDLDAARRSRSANRTRHRRADAQPAVGAERRPAAGCGREPAARRAQRPAGAFARLIRRLLRALVVGLGGAGAAARPVRSRAMRIWGTGSPRSSIRCATRRRGWRRGDRIEIRRLKGRVDSERLPRGADATTHTKLGRGGLADIEWTVQLLQLAHGHGPAGLRTTAHPGGARGGCGRGIAEPAGRRRARRARGAWQAMPATRSMLVRDRADDQLPALGVALVGGRPGARIPGRTSIRASSSTTTAGPRAGPARWWNASSTARRHAPIVGGRGLRRAAEIGSVERWRERAGPDSRY